MPTGVYLHKSTQGFQKGHTLNNGRHWEMSEKGKLNIKVAQTGKKLSKNHKRNIGKGNKGRIVKEETKKKISISHLGKPCLGNRGDKSPLWKGGITPIHLAIRKSLEYRIWRKAVYERDNYTCVWCGDKTSGNLEADHIKRFADYPELRFVVDNGRTLCKKCHRTTETYGR